MIAPPSQGSNLADDMTERKKSVFERARGAVEKGVKTAQRYVHEQFLEDTKQAAIDTLLSGGSGLRERRVSSVSVDAGDIEPITLLVGTWNVNGKICSADDLQAWLRAPALKLWSVPLIATDCH